MRLNYNGRQIFHFGVNASQIHPAIQVWTKRFLPPSAVISHAKERSAAELMKRRTMSNEPSPQEQETLRQVAASIWQPWIVNYWDMNAAVGNILATVTGEILKCSIAYSFVPQQILDPFTKPQLKDAWRLVKAYFKQIIHENYKISQNQRYQSCIYVAAANWRSPIEMASAGI